MEEQPNIRGFQDLVVWQKAVALTVQIYQVTKDFPREELYGLTSQIRRAAVSIPSNIAEGQGRGSPSAFASHLDIAIGSASELETQLTIAERIGFLPHEQFAALLTELTAIIRMLYGLLRKIQPGRHFR